MDYLDKARRVIDLEISELRRLYDRLDGVALGRAIDLLLRSLENRGKIVVVGVGKSGHVGEKIAATLTSTGSPRRRATSLDGYELIEAPSSSTVPASGARTRARDRSRVDLPHALGPTMTVNSPSGMVTVRCSATTREG